MGLETPQVDPSTSPLGMGLETLPARPLNIPSGYGPGDPLPVDRMRDTCKNITSTNYVADGNKAYVLISELIAFHAVLTSYFTIAELTPVIFNQIVLNEGNG